MGLGARGAGSAPASPSDILQDLQFGVESDGLTLKDNKAGANVDEPELRNVAVVTYDGSGDCATVDSSTGLFNFGTSDFTIEIKNVNMLKDATEKVIVSKNNSSSINTSAWFFRVDVGNNLDFVTVEETTQTVHTSTVLSANWTAGVRDVKIIKSGSTIDWEIDGVPATDSGNVAAADIQSVSVPVQIGCRGGSSTYFNDHIGQVIITGGVESINLPSQELVGAKLYDISGNGNHATLNANSTLTTMRAARVSISASHNHQYGFTQASSAYSITPPNGGYDRIYDPTTASMGEAFDVLATLVEDVTGTVGSWTVTNPASLFVFNPNTATSGNFLDVLSAIANEVESLPVATAYTITEPAGGRVRAFNPNTDTAGVAYDVLATVLLDMQESAIIG